MKSTRRATFSAAAVLSMAPSAMADCSADFEKMMHGNIAIKNYRAESTASFTDGTTTKSIVADTRVRLPDSLMLIKDSGVEGKKQEIVVIDRKGQARLNGGAWGQVPQEGVDGLLKSMVSNGFGGTMARSNLECLGSQTRDGKPRTAYRYVSGGMTWTMYVDPVTNLPDTAEASLDAGKEGTGKGLMRFTYGDSVVIEMPK